VAPTAIDRIVAHAREAAPAECCGLLLGTGSAIADAAPAKNIADAPRSRFVIDPKDHIDGRRHARRRGLEVIGFYHSHPRSAPVPSSIDRAEAAYPGYLYLIVSLAVEPPDIALFSLDGAGNGNFLPLPFVTVA